MRFTQEQIDQAKQVPVERIAKFAGYTVVKKGRYFSLAEMDSLMINTRKNLWWRYSNGTHGNSIDFLIEFANYSFQQAVKECLEVANIDISFQQDEIKNYRKDYDNTSSREMKLPKRSDRFQRLYAYLMKKRKLSSDTIQFFIRKQLLYEEEKYHNIVFLGRDKKGKIQYAGVHGTLELNGKKAFRGDVEGNNKSYGIR